MRSCLVHFAQVHWHNQHFLLVDTGFSEQFTRRSRDKALSPKFYPLSSQFLMADPIWYRDIAAVGYGMTALDCFPGIVLSLAVFIFFVRVPTDGCGIKKDFRACHGRQAGRFRVPLIPTNQHPYFAMLRLPGSETEISRR